MSILGAIAVPHPPLIMPEVGRGEERRIQKTIDAYHEASARIVRLAPDLLSLRPFDDGEMYKEVTPQGYTEGPFMLKRNGKYYFMWSEGGWGGPDYCVAYAIADSPFGPFERVGKILQQDPAIATGAGHHSVIQVPGKDEYYIVYHRRPLTETAANSRETCIDRLYFDKDGHIVPVKMTNEGVKAVKKPKRK